MINSKLLAPLLPLSAVLVFGPMAVSQQSNGVVDSSIARKIEAAGDSVPLDGDAAYCMRTTSEAAILFSLSEDECSDHASVPLTVTRELDDGTLILTGYGI